MYQSTKDDNQLSVEEREFQRQDANDYEKKIGRDV
jgi:hypothetical protein